MSSSKNINTYKRIVLILGDLAVLLTSFIVYLEYFFWKVVHVNKSFREEPQWYLLLFLVWILVAFLFKLYDFNIVFDLRKAVRQILIGAFVFATIYLFIPFLTPSFPFNRLSAYTFLFIMTFNMSLWRIVYFFLLRKPIVPKKKIIIGFGEVAEHVIDAMLDTDKRHTENVKIFGYLDIENVQISEYRGVKRLTHTDEIVKYVKRLAIDEVILSLSKSKKVESRLYQDLLALEQDGITVKYASDAYEGLTGRVLVLKQEDKYITVDDFSSHNQSRLYLLIINIINKIIGVIGVLGLLIFIPFVWMGNIFFNKGNLFFRQERNGKRGEKIYINKFRSMVTDAEKDGAKWATDNDNRITPLGKFLRKTRIDEFPQFINILKGNMNLIGPRPEREVFVKELEKEIPFFRSREIIKPGLTGWAQVKYKYGNSVEDSLIKLQYDLYYIKHRSLWLDLLVIYKTIGVMFGFKGT